MIYALVFLFNLVLAFYLIPSDPYLAAINAFVVGFMFDGMVYKAIEWKKQRKS